MWARVVNVARRAVTVIPSLDREASESARATSGPVPITSPKSSENGPRTIDLTARALSLHNRNRALAAEYLRRHAILAKGRCSDG